MRRCQALPCRLAAASLIMEVQQDASTFAAAPPHPSPKRKACWFCTSDNKISTRCQKYDAHICKTHSIITWHSSKWKQTVFFSVFDFMKLHACTHIHTHFVCCIFFFLKKLKIVWVKFWNECCALQIIFVCSLWFINTIASVNFDLGISC